MAVASGEGPAHDLTPLGPSGGGIGRGAWGMGTLGARTLGASHVPGVPESGWSLPLFWTSVGRGAWGGRTVAKWTLGITQVSREPESGWPPPLLALICWPDRGKTASNGVEKAFF